VKYIPSITIRILGLLLMVACTTRIHAQLFQFPEKKMGNSIRRNVQVGSLAVWYKGITCTIPDEDDFLPITLLGWKESKKYFTRCSFDFKGRILFDSCSFEEDNAVMPGLGLIICPTLSYSFERLRFIRSVFNVPVRFNNIHRKKVENGIAFDNDFNGSIDFKEDSFYQRLRFDHLAETQIQLSDCFIGSFLAIDSSRNVDLKLDSVTARNNGLFISSQNSQLSLSLGNNDQLKRIILSSTSDSIYDLTYKSHRPVVFDGIFEKSVIAGNIEFMDSVTKNRLSFTRCRFVNSEITTYNIDTLELSDCEFQSLTITRPLWDQQKRLFYLYIKSTAFDNLNFEFDERMSLFFQDEDSPDAINAVFQALLEKFKKEGKSESYKNVDIQFQKYTYNRKGWPGKLWSGLNSWWWNYSYNKNAILRHILLFVTFFFFINLLLGKKLMSFYPIMVFEKPAVKKFRSWLQQVIRIFILTLFIFFSLKIDFDKIDANRTRMMLYFFLQYFVGLICLFFLFNAVFKL